MPWWGTTGNTAGENWVFSFVVDDIKTIAFRSVVFLCQKQSSERPYYMQAGPVKLLSVLRINTGSSPRMLQEPYAFSLLAVPGAARVCGLHSLCLHWRESGFCREGEKRRRRWSRQGEGRHQSHHFLPFFKFSHVSLMKTTGRRRLMNPETHTTSENRS